MYDIIIPKFSMSEKQYQMNDCKLINELACGLWFTKYFHFAFSLLQPNIKSNGKQMSLIRISKLLFIQFNFMP